MKSFLIILVVLFAAVNADFLEDYCRVIRENPDLVDDFIKCEDDNYPPRFLEISADCGKNVTGLDREDYLRATCANRQFLNDSLPKLSVCIHDHSAEIMEMMLEVMRGVQQQLACSKAIVEANSK